MFFKKYKFPLPLFLVLEKSNPIVYSSEILSANHYICFLDVEWYYLINLLLKRDVFFNLSTLLEMSALDTKNYNQILPEIESSLLNKRLLLHNNYYIYTTKTRLTIFYSYALNNCVKLKSLSYLYKNTNWLERELSEMFAVFYENKLDTRVLLLDYPKDNHPMLKDFPTESWGELYYDFLDKSLQYTDLIDHTEL